MLPTPEGTVPSSAMFNREFLQETLRSAQGDPTLTVTRYKVAPATSKGDGYLSDLFRVTMAIKTDDSAECERSCIVKCHPKGGYREDYCRTARFFERELNMIMNTLPEMYHVLKNAHSELKLAKFSPKYVFSGSESDYIMMEDLTESGFKMIRTRGLDLDHCMLVMRSLAILHAVSVVLNKLNPECMNDYKRNTFCAETRQYMESYLVSTIRSLASQVEKWDDYKERYSDKIISLADRSWQKIIEATALDESSFNVLNHGDLWINNILFRNADNDQLKDLSFIDFQMSHFTSPAIDLHYFLYTSPAQYVRVHHHDDLLLEYHKSLCQVLNYLGCVEKAPTFLQLQLDLRKRMFYAMFAASSMLPTILSEPDKGFDLELSLKCGNSHQSDNCKLYSGEEYRNEMQRLLPIFEQNGVF